MLNVLLHCLFPRSISISVEALNEDGVKKKEPVFAFHFAQ